MMKKLIVALVAVVFSTASFAQDQKAAETQTPAAQTKAAETKMPPTHCYAMKDGAMTHCMKTQFEPMTKDVTLKNGTIISAKGEVTTRDGKKTMLANGQCIDPSGVIGDFSKMHPDMKMENHKMEEMK